MTPAPGRYSLALHQHARRKVSTVRDPLDARSFDSEASAQKKADWANWGDGKRPWKAKSSGRPGLWVVTKTFPHYDGGDPVTVYLAPAHSALLLPGLPPTIQPIALHQALSIEASPELHPVRQTNYQTTYRFAPRALPWLFYDLYVYREPDGGVGVSFGVSKESLPDVARHLGYESTDEMDDDLPGQDALGVKTLGLGDLTVVQDCYSAVLKALEEWQLDNGPPAYVQFEADADDPSRVRFYRRFAQIVRKTFDLEGPVTEDTDGAYVYFRVFREEPRQGDEE